MSGDYDSSDISTIMKKVAYNKLHLQSMADSQTSLVNDINWNSVLKKAISDKMLIYYIIDTIDTESGEIKTKEEFLNMTHLTEDLIIEEVTNLRFKLGLLSILY